MANQRLNGVPQHLREMAAVHTNRESSDRELLDRFLAARDESAFTVLIERHGPMVLGALNATLLTDATATFCKAERLDVVF